MSCDVIECICRVMSLRHMSCDVMVLAYVAVFPQRHAITWRIPGDKRMNLISTWLSSVVCIPFKSLNVSNYIPRLYIYMHP